MGSCAHSQGRGVVQRRSALTGVITGMLLLAGCAVGAAETGDASPEPRADLAREAETIAGSLARANPEQRARAGSRGDRPGAADHARPARTAQHGGPIDTRATGRPSGGTATGPEPWVELASLDDPSADHGNGPGYADLTGVSFSEHDGTLAATVTVGGALPGRLAAREVQGIGIDLFRSSSDESDYQVFLDGGRHGWRAFLQTPDGFVRFPGYFGLSGRTLRVSVPWDALGGREDAEVSVFADWSSGVEGLSSDGTPRFDLLPEK